MMGERNVQQRFWAKAIHTIIVILNKDHFIPNNDKTPYEIWYAICSTFKHFIVFGNKCYIKRNDEKLGKFDAKADEGIFLGYSHNSKGYRCYKKNTNRTIDCIDFKVDEYIEYEDNKPINTSSTNPVNNDEKVDEPFLDEYNEKPPSPQAKDPSRYVKKHHPIDKIVGDLNTGV